MNKTISITLDGQLFHVEEPAYLGLDRYLQAVRAHFSTYPDRDEIVSDIESRIAEQFNAKVGGTNRVINQADVEEIIKIMGTVEDFKAFDDATGETKEKTDGTGDAFSKRKLYRDPDDKILGGVASGLAAYFGFDTTLVRIIFALTLFVGGTGVVAYLILWLVVPEASTPSEKMAMRGERITIADLEKKFRDTVGPAAESVKKNETLKKSARMPLEFLSRLFHALGRVVSLIGRLILKLAGLFLLLGSTVAIFSITFAAAALLTNWHSPYVDFPWRDIMAPVVLYVLALCAFFAAFVPLLFILIGGVSLLSGVNKFRTSALTSLGVLWLVALLIGGTTALRYTPQYAEAWRTQREAALVSSTKAFDVKDFDSINIADGYRLQVKPGATFVVKASGDKQLVDQLELFVENGQLKARETSRAWRFCLFCLSEGVNIDVTMPLPKLIRIGNGVAASVTGFTQDALEVQVSNGSRLELDNTIANLTLMVDNGSSVEGVGHHASVIANVKNASRVELSGTSDALTADVRNGSRLQADDLPVQNATVTANDASRATVQVHGTLKGSARNGSRITNSEDTAQNQLTADDSSSVDPQ